MAHERATLAAQPDPWAARQQMALSLGWHIIIACVGVEFPAFVILAEATGLRRRDPDLLLLARRWSKTLGVPFAAGVPRRRGPKSA